MRVQHARFPRSSPVHRNLPLSGFPVDTAPSQKLSPIQKKWSPCQDCRHQRSARQFPRYCPCRDWSPSGRSSRTPVSYTHLRAHETRHDLVCRLLLEKKKKKKNNEVKHNTKTKQRIKINIRIKIK